MAKKILLNVGPLESRAAIVEDGKLCELIYEISNDEKVVGCIYKGRVSNVIAGTQSAFVDVGMHKDAYLTLTGVENSFEMELQDIFKSPIQDMLKVGQDVVLQILKEPTPTKGARSSMTISFPGKYLVFIPRLEHIGVSRRIHNEKERDRLKSIGKKLLPEGGGLVFRTASEGLEEIVIKRDLDLLVKMWKKVEEKIASAPSKTMLHRDIPLPMKVARDYFTDDVEEMIIDSEEAYMSIVEDCEFLTPMQRASLELYKDKTPIFEKYGIEKDIQKAFSRKIWLDSGGYIFIDKTEAMYCIDVNSGRFSSSNGLEETVFKVNLEAAKEIARQIRLRNLAGMIIVDFIDMQSYSHRAQVLKAFKEGFRGDRNRPYILDFSDLGLVQMTRRRTAASLDEIRKASCPCCSGHGKILSLRSIANDLMTELTLESRKHGIDEFTIQAHKSVIELMKSNKEISELEKTLDKKLTFITNEGLNVENYSITPVFSVTSGHGKQEMGAAENQAQHNSQSNVKSGERENKARRGRYYRGRKPNRTKKARE
jgi:ribonuclease G